MRAITGARVLTNAECFAIIEEQKQTKKQQEEIRLEKQENEKRN